ncbi:alpha/beta fold hydrolase [Deinococcus metallilatus]|uniref:Pimeloyl-ACP methyl ester carboxylesterase n=1 Tax=Deinococcus metallilatus TaxID=1211322 RepID=A0ABR6MTX2_9DEIO|nr:alpha/beta fold hydrolase [Deinococcus metallilatus]MBB5295367.1 pimeloyl-ACP methyl ester carboxylesterase [Deinococcus metallilatus]GMA16044.1 hypothetical protein GCM10025871_23750 [Deinococcus metallilatus]
MSLTYHTPGLVMTDREFEVPLDHARPDGPTITVFAREVARPEGLERPYLVFFQGGPGSEAPRPLTAQQPAWLPRALQDFRVLLLDQRGTGRSTPVGTLPGWTPEAQAAYLKCFRADAIVRDAEFIRQALGVERWSVLGQSFGGFCVTTYLSIAPEGLAEALITGGLPALGHHPDEVYRATYARVLERNRRFYARYPQDLDRVRALVGRLEQEDVRLPNGDRLTPRRFRQLGQILGMSDGLEKLHFLLDLPFGSPAFLHDVAGTLSFARNPLYAVLHEACWADGSTTNWSAQRVRKSSARRSCSPERWCFPGCSRSTPPCARCVTRRNSWPPNRGARCTTRCACGRTPSLSRPPCTPRTCTSSGPSRRRRPV